MGPYPENGKDLAVTVVEFIDRSDPGKIRLESCPLTTIESDLVLLYSVASLGIKTAPTPKRYNPSPLASSEAFDTERGEIIGLLGYNGKPTISQLQKMYPDTPLANTIDACRNLWVDRLSYATGPAVASSNIHSICHRISCYNGMSGGALVDKDGFLIGDIFLYHV